MHTFDVQEILRRTLSGASRQAIARELGISKSTVQRYLDRIKQANLTLEQAIGLKPNDLESRLGIGTTVRSGFHEPDFETRLNELGYDCHDETNNPAFRFFLAG